MESLVVSYQKTVTHNEATVGGFRGISDGIGSIWTELTHRGTFRVCGSNQNCKTKIEKLVS